MTWPPQFQSRVFVIAEIGKNFIQSEDNRSVAEYLENAKKLVRAAKDSGADAVKFQTHSVEDEVLPINFDSPHFKGMSRYHWVKRNTESTPVAEFWAPLKKYCDEIGIVFFSTPMSRGAARILDAVGVELWKIGSADILDFPTLDFIAGTKKPIIISSGMSTREELDAAVQFLSSRGADFMILHCVSQYPCAIEDLRLGTIPFLRAQYSVPIGFSDHSLDIDSASIAVALGAEAIEKHFSFSRDLWGPDHKVSLTPPEFKEMVSRIRELESDDEKKQEISANPLYRGVEAKVLQNNEAVLRPVFRKSLVAARDIPAGTKIRADMIYAMRPQQSAGGLPSEAYEHVLGRTLKSGIKKYEPITHDVV